MKVTSIEKSFSNRLLFKDISFELNHGIVQLIGKSGSGKSTFIRILMNEIKADKGFFNIADDKEPIIAYAGPDDSYCVDLTIRENYKAIFNSDLSKQSNELVELLSLNKFVDKKIINLSGGERQKAALLFALSKNADLYCLDEPFASLDEISRAKLKDYLEEFSKTHLLIIANHFETASFLKYDILIDFDKQGEVTCLTNQPLNTEVCTSASSKSKTLSLPIKTFFRAFPFQTVLIIVLSFLTFLTFFSGLSFYDNNTERQEQYISTYNSNNEYFSLNCFQKETAIKPPYSMVDDGIDVFRCSIDNTECLFVFSSLEDNVCFYSSNEEEKSFTFNIDSTNIAVEQIIDKDNFMNLLPKAYLIDKFMKNSNDYYIFLSSKSMFEKMITSNTCTINKQNIIRRLEYSPIETNYDLKIAFNTGNIKVTSSNGSAFGVANTEKDANRLLFLNGSDFCFSLSTNCACDSGMIIGSNIYRLIMSTQQYNMLNDYCYYSLQNKNKTLELITENEDLKVKDIILDYSKDNIIYEILLLSSLVLLIAVILVCLLGRKGIASWRRNLYSFYQKNSIKKSQIKRDISFTIINLVVWGYLLSLFSYLTFMIPVANLIMKNNFTHGYVEVEALYNQRYSSPIPFLYLKAYALFSFLILVIFVLVLVLFFKNVNQNKETKKLKFKK